jgi:hypothetical protein
MKKFLLVALLGAFGVSQQLKAEEATSNNTIDYTLDHAYKLDGKDVFSQHDINFTHKFSDDLKIAFQGNFYEHYRTKGDKGEVSHGTYEDYFWRLKFIGSPFIDIGGFKTSWEVRYLLPVDEKSQKAGTYGTINPRLTMAREFNSSYSLTMVAKFALPLNRKSYEVNSSATNNPNDLIKAGFAIVPEWKILPNLSFSNEFDIGFTAKGKAPYNINKDNKSEPINEVRYSYNISNEASVVYNIKNFYDLGVGGFWQIEYPFGNGTLASPEASFEKGSHHTVGIRLAKTFNL